MKRSSRITMAVLASLALGMAAVAVFAHSGMGPGTGAHEMTGAGMMRGPMGGAMAGHMNQDDAAFPADMSLVHAMLQNNEKIERKVVNLPDGIRTVTESDDAQTAQAIKAHVASMETRLKEGRIFNLFSSTLPVLFENKDKIRTVVETTDKGAIVTQTSGDPKIVAALQAHAAEVSELARDSMAAMMRGMRTRMATTERAAPQK